MIPAAAVAAAARVIGLHLPDSAYANGCAPRCGYVGDDLDEHLAAHILEAVAPYMPTIDDALWAEFQEATATAGTNPSETIRQLIRDWTNNRKATDD